jgi:hypothetical protein
MSWHEGDEIPIAWGDFQGTMPSNMPLTSGGWGRANPKYAAWYATYNGPHKDSLPPPTPTPETTASLPAERALWERLAPKGYRASDQDPRMVNRALYGQDTPPDARIMSSREGPTGVLRAKLGVQS